MDQVLYTRCYRVVRENDNGQLHRQVRIYMIVDIVDIVEKERERERV